MVMKLKKNFEKKRLFVLLYYITEFINKNWLIYFKDKFNISFFVVKIETHSVLHTKDFHDFQTSLCDGYF